MISSLSWSLDFLFSAPFWITSSNSFLLQPPFTISAPTIIMWHSYSLPSLICLLPTPQPLFCFKLLISLFLHSHHPLFHFYFFRLLSTAFNIIYTITNWRVSLSKICLEWPNNAVTHSCVQLMSGTHEWVTTLFGHEWHIFDNETRQLVIVFII
jgi:hypothetical protein